MSPQQRRALRIDDPVAGSDLCHVAPLSSGESPSGRLHDIAIQDIHANPSQPRKHFDDGSLAALADSIRERGVLQPIIVQPRPDGGYELIAGERRWRASQIAGSTTIPALVSQPVGGAQSIELALIENVARRDLGVIEEARTIAVLLDELDVTATTLARRLGRSRSDLAHTVRLLELPDKGDRAAQRRCAHQGPRKGAADRGRPPSPPLVVIALRLLARLVGWLWPPSQRLDDAALTRGPAPGTGRSLLQSAGNVAPRTGTPPHEPARERCGSPLLGLRRAARIVTPGTTQLGSVLARSGLTPTAALDEQQRLRAGRWRRRRFRFDPGQRSRPRARDLDRPWRAGHRPHWCSATKRATCMLWAPLNATLSDTPSHQGASCQPAHTEPEDSPRPLRLSSRAAVPLAIRDPRRASETDAIIQAVSELAGRPHTEGRPCNRPVPRRREIKAVVRSGAHRRSLLGDSSSAMLR
jgi:ParB/RepB/Spo0J family partition protein